MDLTQNSGRPLRIVVFAILVLHSLALAWCGLRHSPAGDEAGHLSAGVYIWHYGKFDLYRVNPPLVRAVATIPVVLASPKTDWTRYRNGLRERSEWRVGQSFIASNGERTFWFFTYARWACIPFCLLGAYVCFKWSSQLYGPTSGILALLLWCFSPNILAWGATICPDATASALGIVASFAFWNWLREPSVRWTLTAGIALGFVLLSKMTWVILFPVWPFLWIVWSLINHKCIVISGRQFLQMALMLTLAILTINLGYSFEGSFQPLEDFTFASRSLAGPDSFVDGGEGGNRFRGHAIGKLPVPFPVNFVYGMDVQKWDFERGKWSFLCGEWKLGGWWYYYIVCAFLKVPLGTWALAAVATATTIQGEKCQRKSGELSYLANELVLLAPALAVLFLVSSQTGFARYFRYVLPCMPFAFIWISKVGQLLTSKRRFGGGVVVLCLVWSLASSVFIFPHSMSYFNELTGGPQRGHQYLVDANIDWGQDIFYLKEWLHQHQKVENISFARRGFFDPTEAGVQWRPAKISPASLVGRKLIDPDQLGPEPGWHAVSVHLLQLHTEDYSAFFDFKPITTVGYSTNIYYISLEDANTYRRKLGLPAWEPDAHIPKQEPHR